MRKKTLKSNIYRLALLKYRHWRVVLAFGLVFDMPNHVLIQQSSEYVFRNWISFEWLQRCEWNLWIILLSERITNILTGAQELKCGQCQLRRYSHFFLNVGTTLDKEWEVIQPLWPWSPVLRSIISNAIGFILKVGMERLRLSSYFFSTLPLSPLELIPQWHPPK